MYPFIRQEDCSMRLDGTVGSYKGLPVYITVSNDFPTNAIHIEPFEDTIRNYTRGGGLTPSPRRVSIDVTDREFHAYPPVLGYVNIEGLAIYVKRNAERRPRQGLGAGALSFNSRGMFRQEHIMFSMPMHDMLTNNYPSFKTVIDNIRKGTNRECAFSKEFAVFSHTSALSTNPWVLKFCDRDVGVVDKKTEAVSLNDSLLEKSFIAGYLTDLGVPLK